MSTPCGASSSSKSFPPGPAIPSAADPAGRRVPSSCMRISWTPLWSEEATTAYGLPPVPLNTETAYAPNRRSKPRVPLTAELTASMVPS